MTKAYKILTISSLILASTAMSLSSAPASQAAAQPAVSSTVNTPTAPVADAWVNQTLSAINVYRAKEKLPPLKLNTSISSVSQEWADHLGKEMVDPDFDWAGIHRADAGRSKLPAGFGWYSEVVAFNFTAQATVDWWMNSPSHKAAIMNSKATDIGIGYAVPETGPYAGWHQTVANVVQYPTTSVAPPISVTPPVLGAASNVVSSFTEGKTAIAAKAKSLNGSIGNALYDEVTGLRDDGILQNFQKGTIYWSKATGAHIVRGAILSAWGKTGWESGRLGYPKTDEIAIAGGVYQEFQKGTIYWSSSTGAHVMVGAVKSKWQSLGGVTSDLGYPTSSENSIKGGVYQTFKGGVIYYSSVTGAHVSKGAIRTAYRSVGYENGRLGYPTTDEYKISNGVKQDYQGGSITWIRGAAKISYK
jgi:uncharacterized protein YkwD